MAATGFCWTACSDKEEDIKPGTDDDKTDAYYVMTPAQIADYATDNFICHVCKVEIDSATAKLTSWEVNYGRVLHPETPNVRYARAETLEKARQEFLSMICMEATIDSASVIGAMTVPMGSHGTVKYTPNEQNGEWARVEVNLKELPDLQTIVFCKPEAWPENAGNCGVAIHSVYKRKEKRIKEKKDVEVFYVCVRESRNGTGYLIGFDTWTVEPTGPNHYYRDRNCYDQWWWNLPGGAGLIEDLRGLLYDYKGNKYDKGEKIIRYISKNQAGHQANYENCGDDPLYNFLYSEGKLKGRRPFFKTGDDHCWVDEHDPLFVSGVWHWVRTPYTMIEPTHISWSKIAYECDEIDPRTHDKSNTHTCNVEQGSNWGAAWCCYDLSEEWIWKVGEWFSFQTPYIIEYHDTDAENLADFMNRYNLTKVNIQ